MLFNEAVFHFIQGKWRHLKQPRWACFFSFKDSRCMFFKTSLLVLTQYLFFIFFFSNRCIFRALKWIYIKLFVFTLSFCHMVILVVAKHPQQWTKEEVAAWLRWCGEEYSIETVPADKFDMNGKDNTVSSLFCYQRNWNFKKKNSNFKTNHHFEIKAIFGRTV